MNEHFSGTTNGGNQLSLGYTSFSVSPKNEFWSSATPWDRKPWVEISEPDVSTQVSRWTQTHFWAKLLDTENDLEPNPWCNMWSVGPGIMPENGKSDLGQNQYLEQCPHHTKPVRYQPMGAINLVWAIHHFPYHLKMSFGPARRLGLGQLGSRYLNQIYWSKCRAGPKLIFEQSC